MSLDTPATVFLIENHDAMHDFVCFVSDILTFSRFIFHICLDFCILWLLLLLLLLFKKMKIIK